ncbi:MAG: hypothetical protein ACKOCX_03930 [Planctomycetota bacterium]
MNPQHGRAQGDALPRTVAAGFRPAETAWPRMPVGRCRPPRSVLRSRHCRPGLVLAAALAALAAGCKSDLNQQLLERELRYQEDQIYQLQDELAEKCARLEHVAGENVSLRRQLGVSDTDPAAPSRGRRPRTPGVPPAATVPPAIEVPDAGPLPAPRGGGPPTDLAPPTLEGVPPLPAEPGKPPVTSDAGEGLSLPPAAASFDPAARPIEAVTATNSGPDPAEPAAPTLVRMSYDEAADGGEAVRLAVNQTASSAVDADGDGHSEGITIAIEPRTAGERLTAVGGDVTITAFDTAAPPAAPPLARWTVSAADAQARFRPSGRRRGVVLDLPWQGTLPTGKHVRVVAEVTTAAGPLVTEALLSVR